MEKNKFQLNKGTDRSYDLSKGGKRKFDLTKEVDEPIVTLSGSDGPVGGGAGTNSKSRKIWLWFALVVVAALLAYFLWPTANDVAEDQAVENAMQPEDETTDSVTDEATATPDADAQSEGAAEIESEPTSTELPATTSEAAPKTNSSTNATALDNIEAQALKVIQGDYGVGQERKNKLGTQYQAVQNRVNELKREGVF